MAKPADEIVLRLVAEGAKAHADLVLREASTAWARHLEAHFPEGEGDAEKASLHAPDIHLVLACLAGDTLAHARLDERLRAVTPQALAGIREGTLAVDDLLQDVRAKLLVGDAGVGKLGSYAGRGPLDGWLRVTVARAAISVIRAKRPPDEADEPEALLAIASAHDPELDALRARAGPLLERAIEESVASLADDDKTLLKLYFVDGLTIDDLAALYRLHRATAARRLARVRNAVFEDARARAVGLLGVREDEFKSLVGAMLSKLDVTLRRLLGADGATP
jgi:RNA polymerase sigma-70 factor, ECF subfamily